MGTMRKLRWKCAKALISKDEQNFLSGVYKSVSQYKMYDKTDSIEAGGTVYIKVKIEEIRDGKALCKNKFGYYYSVSVDEIAIKQTTEWDKDGKKYKCRECGYKTKNVGNFCPVCGLETGGIEK